jgi:hypothetical protein
MAESMHWIKERIMEFERKDPAYAETFHRIYFRFRSDGSMWYQQSRRGGFYDQNPVELEKCFSRFLASVVPVTAHSGWSEQDFDEDFLEHLRQMNGKEITITTQ